MATAAPPPPAPEPEQLALPVERALFSPVGYRIAIALHNRELTTAALEQAVPDVPRSTLYRQVNRLIEAGGVSVVAERPVRGASERVLALHDHDIVVSADELPFRPEEWSGCYALWPTASSAASIATSRGRRLTPVADEFRFLEWSVRAGPEAVRQLRREIRLVLDQWVARHPASEEQPVEPGPGGPARQPRRYRIALTLVPEDEPPLTMTPQSTE